MEIIIYSGGIFLREFNNIKLVKFPKLDEIDDSIAEKALTRFVEKTVLSNTDELNLTYKEYSKGGLRKQHEIKARAVINSKVFVASETGWKLLDIFQDVLKKLEKEVLKSTSK